VLERYGLGGEHPRTLDEAGRTFAVTRERIRQIEKQSECLAVLEGTIKWTVAWRMVECGSRVRLCLRDCHLNPEGTPHGL
jgi:Sigma-70, region 4